MTRPPPVVVVTGRHRPHEQAFNVIATVLGAVYLLDVVPAPRVVDAFLPGRWAVLGWSAVLAAGGVASAVGSYWAGRRGRGLVVEQGGQLLQAAAVGLWAAASLAVAGMLGIVGVLLFGAWAAACGWRAWQVGHDLAKAEQRDGR